MQTFQWTSSRSLSFLADGKHQMSFPPDFPILIQCFDFSINYHLASSYHDHLEIIYIYEGRGAFCVEGKEYPVEQGDILLVGSKEFHVLEPRPRYPLKSISIFFFQNLVYTPGGLPVDHEYLDPFFYHDARFSNKIPAREIDHQEVLQRIGQMVAELQGQPRHYQLAVTTYLKEILLLIARHYGLQKVPPETADSRQRDFGKIQPALEYIRSNYPERITLDQVAGMSCLSPAWFCKVFKKVTGTSLTDYLIKMRIDKAKELLASTDLPVTSIAAQTGFTGHNYFDRVFRRLTHYSPLEFRSRVRE